MEGRNQTRTWEKDGQKMSKTETALTDIKIFQEKRDTQWGGYVERREVKESNFDDLTDQLDAKNSSKRYSKEQEALADITSSNDSYHFVKEYTYNVSSPTNQNKQKKIMVKMHAPSVAEQAKIQGNYVELTNGLGDGFLANAKDLFLAISYFQVVGDNVPVWFTNLDNTYRTDVLFQVWGDYQEWLYSFLDTQVTQQKSADCPGLLFSQRYKNRPAFSPSYS